MLFAQTSSSSSFTLGPVGWAWSLIGLAFAIYVLVDVLRRPAEQWQAAGQNRGLWIGLSILGIFCCGIVIGLVYMLAIRPKLESAATRGVSGGYPPAGGYPPPGGYQPPQGFQPPPPPGSYPPPAGGGFPPPPPPQDPGSGWPPPPPPPAS